MSEIKNTVDAHAAFLEYIVSLLIHERAEKLGAIQHLLDSSTHGFCTVSRGTDVIVDASPVLLETFKSTELKGTQLTDYVDSVDAHTVKSLCEQACRSSAAMGSAVVACHSLGPDRLPATKFDVKILVYSTSEEGVCICFQVIGENRTAVSSTGQHDDAPQHNHEKLVMVESKERTEDQQDQPLDQDMVTRDIAKQTGNGVTQVATEKPQKNKEPDDQKREQNHSEWFFSRLLSQAFGGLMGEAYGSIFNELRKRGKDEHWLLSKDEVDLGDPPQQLGLGACGAVLAATLHGSPAVVKVPKKEQDGYDLERVRTTINELRVLRRTRHPNVVIFFGAYLDEQSSSLSLVFERIQGLDLSILVENPKALRNRFGCHCIVLGIWSALRYLHGQRPRVVHGDVKPSNIMVEGWRFEPRARLLDFGLSRLCTPSAEGMGGSVRWMAPELLLAGSDCRPDPTTDIFSAGRLMYFLATGTPPLEGVNREVIRNLAAGACVPALSWGHMDSYAAEMKTSCNQCCQVKPSSRSTSAEQHERLLHLNVHNPASGEKPAANVIGADADCVKLGAIAQYDGDPRDSGAVSVWCDSMTDGYAITECTPAFAKLVGQTEPVGCNFRDWIQDPHAFDTWVRVTLNEAYNDETVEVPLELILKLPANGDSKSCVRMVCILIVEDDEDDPSDVVCVMAVDGELEQCATCPAHATSL